MYMKKLIKFTFGMVLVFSASLSIYKQQLNIKPLNNNVGINNKITKKSLVKNNPMFEDGTVKTILQAKDGTLYVGGVGLGGITSKDNNDHSLYTSKDGGKTWVAKDTNGFDKKHSTINVIYQTKNGDIYVGGEGLGDGTASLCKFNKTWQIIYGINGTNKNDHSFDIVSGDNNGIHSQINSILETNTTGKIFIAGSGMGYWNNDLKKKGTSELFTSESSATTTTKWDCITNSDDNGNLTFSNRGTMNTIVQSHANKTIYIGGDLLGADQYKTLYKSNDDGKTWNAIQGTKNPNDTSWSFDNPDIYHGHFAIINSIFIAKNNDIYVGGGDLGNSDKDDNNSLYKSSDKGNTWKIISDQSKFYFKGFAAIVHSINEDINDNIYVGGQFLGGKTITTTFPCLFKFDAKSSTWGVSSNENTSFGIIYILLITDKYFAIGGTGMGSTVNNAMFALLLEKLNNTKLFNNIILIVSICVSIFVLIVAAIMVLYYLKKRKYKLLKLSKHI